jgi:formate hydrogenlyase subunit 3/multisubunit Na+/H+ antiporter MnhD subunit
MLGRNADAGGRWSAFLLIWLLVSAIPLLFVFAYSRFLFAESTTHAPPELAAIVSGMAAILATILFSFLATPFWKNPARDLGDSMIYQLVAIAVLPTFLAAGILLLLSKKSSLTIVNPILRKFKHDCGRSKYVKSRKLWKSQGLMLR